MLRRGLCLLLTAALCLTTGCVADRAAMQAEAEQALLAQQEEALRQEEAHVIRKLLEDTQKLPVDTKVQSLITVIDKLQHDGYRQVIVFTQYTDSLDFLRQQLVRHRTPGSILCFSGRGGERWGNQSWEIISR